jgi:hypothetical protein
MGKPVITFTFFDRIEVGSLKILNQSQSQYSLVVDLLDDCRNFLPGKLCRGAEAALTSDQFKSIFAWSPSNGYRLKETARFETFLKLGHLIGVEFPSWLEWVATNLADWDRF